VATLNDQSTPITHHVAWVRIDSATEFTIFLNVRNPAVDNNPLKVAWHVFDG
jgi:hypothetical protein